MSLVWACIRTNSSFLRKQRNLKPFSAEKVNVASQHAFKYSGLANSNASDVELAGTKLVVVSSKASAKKPAPVRTGVKSPKAAKAAVRRADLAPIVEKKAGLLNKSFRGNKRAAHATPIRRTTVRVAKE